MLGKKKRRHTATAVTLMVAVLVLSTTALMVPEAALAIGGPPPPSVTLEFERGWTASPKCSAEYTVTLTPHSGFQGAVNLTLTDPPKGVTMDIYPNPVMLSFWGQNSIVFPMTIIVSSDTPNGTYKAKVTATALPGPGSILYDEAYNNKTATRFYGYFTLAVGKCGDPLPGTTTTTTTRSTPTTSTISTTTTTVTTTVTITLSPTLTSATTIQSGEQPPEYSTYAWAISATVATIVLATVLMLQRRRTR